MAVRVKWDEDALGKLEPHEHDYQEFKSSDWVLSRSGLIRGDFRVLLSKQVSAFANGAGGRVFVGLADDGAIDGGVPVDLKGGGVREWLEDVVPSVVEPPLPRCNVFEVRRSGPSSPIKEGHAVYVIDIPASAEAPHQALDHRYFLRIAGKSRPMGHVHVQDVLRRTHQPKVQLSSLDPYGSPEVLRDGTVMVQFRLLLSNQGRAMAKHVGVELQAPRPLCGRLVRDRMRDQGETHSTQAPGYITFFRYHPAPLFPRQEVYAMSAWVRVTPRNVAMLRAGATIKWRVYADDAAPATGERALVGFQLLLRAIDIVDGEQTAK